MPNLLPFIFTAGSLVILAPFLYQIARPFVTPFLLAVILAIVIYPAHRWVCARVRRPAVATVITTIAAVLLLAGVLGLAGFAVTRELGTAFDTISERSADEGGWPALATRTTDWALDALASRLPIDRQALRTEFLTRMKAFAGYLAAHIGAALGGLTTVLINFVLVTVFLYFLLLYGVDWSDRLASVIPLEHDATRRLFDTVRDSVVANVNGVLIVAMVQGALLAAAFWFIGLRAPLLWGAAGGLASIIPMVGPPLIWVPVAVGFLLTGAYWKAVVLGLWGMLVVGTVDNILRPIIVGAREKLHPVLIALAMIGGTFAFGPLGILLGPLIVSLSGALLKELRRLLTDETVA